MPPKKRKGSPDELPTPQTIAMRWISFLTVTGLFFGSGVWGIITEKPLDKTIGVIFLVVTGFAWGANIWKHIINRLVP